MIHPNRTKTMNYTLEKPMPAQVPTRTTGAVAAATEARESQTIQVAMLAAKRFPRDERRAMDRILNACSRPGLASVSQYQYAKGGTDVAGPSIRLAEAIAAQWGNFESGWREIERYPDTDGVTVSVIEAYAWDLETNVRVPRTFAVRHWRDTKKGGYKITDERDIYELCANQAARRVRACILSVVPGDVVEEAMAQCNATLSATADASPDAQAKILKAFAELGVTREQIEKRLQRRIDAITPAQVVGLKKIFASLRDQVSTIADWFEPASTQVAPVDPFANGTPGAAANTQAGPATPAMAAAQPAANGEEELPL